ncbi:MAG: hypothetical protein WBB22_09950 [Anaerolineae bacterium]
MAKSPLFNKLQMQPGQRAQIMNAPPGYLDELGDLPEGVALADEPEGTFDFVQLFVKDLAELKSYRCILDHGGFFGGYREMTHAEQIMRAVAVLVRQQGKRVLTRAEVRKVIGLSSREWQYGYTAIFQGMRVDHPGGAPDVGDRWKGVFRRVEYGKYVLTDRGQELVRALES